jgi:rifampicin phosphotransferase
MDIIWEAPGPGQWALDRSHTPGGCTPIMQHIATRAMPAGTRRVFAEQGIPLETLDARFVNGQFYSRLRPLISPDRPATKLPPLIVLRVVSRVHPEMRRRNRTAGEAEAAEPWVQVIHDWHHGGRASVIDRNLAFQRIDLTSLSDDDLLAHARTCVEHAVAMFEHHFWLHGYDLGPIGQYLFEALDWGSGARELLSLLEGASPSTTEPQRALVRIRAMVEAAGAQPGTLDEAKAISAQISNAIDQYLETRGCLLFSRYDIDGITLGERPDLVLASIMNAQLRDASDELATRTAAVRARVPAQHVDRFDTILRQARDAMDLRDDNGPNTAEWPLGLMRLALLEVGARMVRQGLVDRPAIALELHPDELHPSLFAGSPDAATLAERAQRRQAMKSLEPPRTLGPPEIAPPPEVLPANLRRLVGMVQTVMQHMGMDGDEHRTGLHGDGVGAATVRGRARVATSPEDALDALEPGDILVVAGTTPAYNLVLSMAGGVVTAEGGIMSHAAVIARELGIPAIVGARSALTDIPNGAMVELDPVEGVVRVLSHV